MHSEKGELSLHGWSDKEALGKVSATLQHFIFIKKVRGFFKHFTSSNFSIFVDWSITDAKLFVYVPTQLDMMIDNTVRLLRVYMYYWEKFLVDQFARSVIVWTGDKSY